MSLLAGLLRRIERVAPSHTIRPVPVEESVPGYRVAIVCVGIAFTLTGLYMGSEIAAELGWRQGVLAGVVGGMIVNGVLMPDLTRYSRSVLDCAIISVAGNGIANGAMLILAMLPALAFREIDPMKYMALLNLLLVAGDGVQPAHQRQRSDRLRLRGRCRP